MQYVAVVLAISCLLGLTEADFERDTFSAEKDPNCASTHCKKPSYDIEELNRDCSAAKKYARCIKRVLRKCRGEKEQLKDRDSMDQLIMEFDAAKSTLAIIGPGCRMGGSVNPLASSRLEPAFTFPVYLGLVVVILHVSRSAS